MIHLLNQIREHISHRGLNITIHDLKKLCADHHLMSMMSKIESVANDYELMTHFFESGFEDSHRNELYQKLQRQLYTLILEMKVDCIADVNPTFKQCRVNALSTPCEYENIEETLSQYDQELAMASLDENAEEQQRQIHLRLLPYRIYLFNLIYTSKPWSKHESEIITKLLLSPFVDVIDQQILLGAMLMAQRMVFDIQKFNTLCNVVCNTDNFYIRSRALVAIALGLPDPVDQDIYADAISSSLDVLFTMDGIDQELVDLQTQLLLCMETTRNDKTINDEIMPTLMKSSQQMMEQNNFDSDNLDSLLHPDIEEKRMEAVEASIDKMRNMQKDGADIFFSSFSQAKRYSFFYTMMNWFCPFYIEHPQLSAMKNKDIPAPFLNKIITGEMFCNSDKYSFILSLIQVINHIPKDILEMMHKGEVTPMFEDKTEGEAIIRRSYLNDLYRFFNLYPDSKSFRNPFVSDESVCIFLNKTLGSRFEGSSHLLRVCRQLLRRRHFNALDKMLQLYADENDVEWLKLKAINHEQKKEYALATRYFNEAIQIIPDNPLLFSRAANSAYLGGQYELALKFYQTYFDLVTEDEDTDVEEYRVALCEFKISRIDDGMKRLFRLSYNDPDNILYRQALAWGYMLQHKFSDAMNVYAGINESELKAVDVLRKSITQWMNNSISEAVVTLKHFVELNSTNKQDNVLDMMFEQLHLLNLEPEVFDKCKIEALILIDLALKNHL